MVPINAKWMKDSVNDDYIGLKTVGELIGIDVVPVMIGWEKNTARATPKFQGYLVYEPKVEEILKAYKGKYAEVVEAEKEEKKRKIQAEADKRKFPCKYCGKRMTKAEYRRVHIQNKHPGKKVY